MTLEIVQGWGSPEGQGRDYRSPFVHLRPGTVRSLIVLADVPIRYFGHWTQGGVRPCAEPSCELCDGGVGRQERYVWDVYDCDDDRTAVWECSRTVAWRMRELAGEPASMHGSCWKCWKSGEKAGSRTEVELWGGGDIWAVRMFGLRQGSTEAIPLVDFPVPRGADRVLRQWWCSRGWLSGCPQEFSTADPG